MPGHQASRPPWRAATALCLATSLVVGLSGCTGASEIQVSGNVDDDLVTVQAPYVKIAEPDLDAGFADADASSQQTTSDQTIGTSSLQSATAGQSSWNRIATVEVREGDQVHAGQVLLRFDSEALSANVRVARTDARVAASQVPVLTSAIEDTYDRERDIRSALKKINKAIHQLKSTRATLSVQLSQARRQLIQLEGRRAQVQNQRPQLNRRLRQVNEQLAELRTGLAQLPRENPNTPEPTAAPAAPNRAQLLATIARLEQARSQLRTGLTQLRRVEGQLTRAITGLHTAIPKLETAIAEIGDGLVKARSQRTKLRKARTKIIDARAELRRTRKLAVVAADAAAVGVAVAENQKLLATVSAPASGVVVQAATPGEVIAAGATVATIRASAGSSVTTWLPPAQLDQICLGSRASVHADWMNAGQQLSATITLIGERADYPPTSFATDEVHLTRAVPVRLTLNGPSAQQQLPPGAPVDIEIQPAANDQNCATETTSR